MLMLVSGATVRANAGVPDETSSPAVTAVTRIVHASLSPDETTRSKPSQSGCQGGVDLSPRWRSPQAFEDSLLPVNLWLQGMTVNGRIMSLSSCSTMWQWYTYFWGAVTFLGNSNFARMVVK